jgi:hypothetical protein
MSNTGRKQEPFVYGALGGSTISLASLTSESRDDKAGSAPSSIDAEVGASRDYEAAAKLGSKEVWDSFLLRHPNGFYADLARAQRAKLAAKSSPEIPDDSAQPSEPAAKKATKSAALRMDPELRPERPKERGSLTACCIAYCHLIHCNSPALPDACSARVFAMYKGMSVEDQKRNYLAGARNVLGRSVTIPACM